ncbi:CHAD domain-containing protein [Wenzhouxiangella sp. XN24]|uniref:CHAD domain-containing protein n=1 Tax=Wenzhouxiangella sp. XN24 TaxID=2713569 RepID=UPI0013EB6530|nr:CHAD domain-containing protein [Wenzhouxiangella sp. XN24]NGX16316.1 CHAD domain-containing protein [Wenzhouxiangella sp. XN24]
MNYQLEINEPIDVGVRRIATELIDDAIARIEAPDRDPHEVVHEVRKDCKKLRGLLRLIRPQVPKLYKAENKYFRDAAAALSGIRDAEAASESYDALLNAFEGEVDRQGLAPVRRALTMHKQHLAEHQGDLDARLEAFGEQMRAARKRVADWRLPADDAKHGKGGFGLLQGGLTKTYARGRKAMDVACGDPEVETFHDWRKRAKYLRYHLRLLRPIWPQVFKCTRKEVKRLGDLLGDDHDFAILEKVLKDGLANDPDEGRLEVLDALMRQRSIQLRDEAEWLGRRIYAEKPKVFRKRIGGYWATAHTEQEATMA